MVCKCNIGYCAPKNSACNHISFLMVIFQIIYFSDSSLSHLNNFVSNFLYPISSDICSHFIGTRSLHYFLAHHFYYHFDLELISLMYNNLL